MTRPLHEYKEEKTVTNHPGVMSLFEKPWQKVKEFPPRALRINDIVSRMRGHQSVPRGESLVRREALLGRLEYIRDHKPERSKDLFDMVAPDGELLSEAASFYRQYGQIDGYEYDITRDGPAASMSELTAVMLASPERVAELAALKSGISAAVRGEAASQLGLSPRQSQALTYQYGMASPELTARVASKNLTAADACDVLRTLCYSEVFSWETCVVKSLDGLLNGVADLAQTAAHIADVRQERVDVDYPALSHDTQRFLERMHSHEIEVADIELVGAGEIGRSAIPEDEGDPWFRFLVQTGDDPAARRFAWLT